VIRITKRRIAWLAAGALVLAAGVYLVRVASILTAYKAKMLCSEVFLGRREANEVERELEVDDLQPLRVITDSVDRHARRVTSTFAGIIARDAAFHESRGCAVGASTDTSRNIQMTWFPGADHEISPDERLRPVIDRAFAEPDPERPRRTRAVVVMHDGRVVAERYANGFTNVTPILGWSMTKTMMNALVGILVKEGRLAVDRPLPIPEWQDPGDPRHSITLDHLLRMSSGLEFDESAWNPVSDVTVMLLGRPDAGLFAARKDLVAAPGTHWQYSSGTTNIISRAIRAVINDDAAYADFPRRALFDRLQMTSAVIETDPSGSFVGSSFGYATARGWARLGLLYVNDGVWEGERILPEGWVAYTRTPAPADPLKRYGAHVWLKVADNYSGDAVLPADAFHAAGHEGQFITMIPSAHLVVVRLGLTRYPNAWDQAGFVRDVLNALEAVPKVTELGGARSPHGETMRWEDGLNGSNDR
jgi:CubicO group peptidase (beta-lactamase class C family)